MYKLIKFHRLGRKVPYGKKESGILIFEICKKDTPDNKKGINKLKSDINFKVCENYLINMLYFW